MPETDVDHQDAPQRPAKRSRKNIIRACDLCKAKKAKCDGLQPCQRCRHSNVLCSFETPYLRGIAPPPVLPAIVPHTPDRPGRITIATAADMLPSVPVSTHPIRTHSHIPDLAHLESPLAPESDHRQISGLSSEAVEGFLGASSNLEYSRAAQLQLRSQPPSPPPTSSERDNTWNGSGSGPDIGEPRQPSLATRGTTALNQRSSLYFSEPPFPRLDLSRYSLPTLQHGLVMISWYFENASPTYRVLHRPTIERVVQSMCTASDWLGGSASYNTGTIENTMPSTAEKALVLLVWALGCQFPLSYNGRSLQSKEEEWLRQRGQDYYQVASLMLEQENSIFDRLIILQAKLLMCLYLLTTSRLKAAWDLFAIVKNMVNNLDLSKPPPIFTDGSGRSRTTQSGQTTPSLLSEMRRRAFWAVYTLDSYLATMLGKNLTFDDRDIRIGYPSLLDDSQIAPFGMGSEEDSDRPPLMLGPIAHAKLARIIRRILTHLYHDQALELQFEYADILLREITEWDNELPEFLRTKPSGSLLNIYARQSAVIQLAKQHALILLYRPFLPLSGLATTPIHGEGVDIHTISQYQDRCLDFALRTCELVTPLMRRAHVNGNYWFTAYIVFCAATVLLVYLGHHTTTSRRDEIWDAAEKCCDIERKLMDTNYLARRYVAAIEGLLARVLKRSQPEPPSTHVGAAEGGEAMGDAAMPFPHWPGDSGLQPSNPMTRPPDNSYLAYSDLPGELFSQPSLDQLISGTYGSNFTDLDSLVTGGMEFGWFS